jgi:adenosylmethionine-8-amino-7-oxononanoate aminotransferase
MAAVEDQAVTTGSAKDQSELQKLAKRHLWMHFTRMGSYDDAEVPIIVRGEGCHVFDEHGKKYFDGLAALFCVNIGHGRHDVAQAGADQAKELGFFTNWSYAHPKSIELAAKIASLAPATSTGSSSRAAARRPSSRRSSCAASTTSSRERGSLQGHLPQPGLPRNHHGGADRHGHPGRAQAVRADLPRLAHVPNTEPLPAGAGMTRTRWPDTIADRIEIRGPETVSAVILEPVQNSGGCFTPPEGYFQRVREICDHYGRACSSPTR